MQVLDVTTRDVYTLAPETTLDAAARLLARHHISGAPVVGATGRPIGVVSLADLVDPHRPRAGYPAYYRGDGGVPAPGADGAAHAGCVADVMSPFVLAIEASASLSAAAQRMLDDGVHRLLVMHDAQLVGIVTSLDLLRGFVQGGR